MLLKLLQKEQLKKLQKELVVWLVIKLLEFFLLETLDFFVGNNIAGKTIKVSKISPQNNLETVEWGTENTWFNREIPKDTHLQKKDSNLMI